MSLLSTESSLLVQLAQGDPVAWRGFVADQHPKVFRLASRFSPADADDVTQETFAAAWASISQFNGQSKLSTWLYRIAVNKCQLAYRRQSQQLAHMKRFAENQLASGTVPDNLGSLADCELVREAFDHLDDESRLLLALLHFEGLSYKQLGEEFGWSSKSTVFIKVHKATDEMKKLLTQLGGGG